jgi:DNA-binding response OmpR family regulator
LRLVLIEDDPSDGEIIARHLAKAGLHCVIHRVETESGLLSALSTVKPDLIISDFTLPRFDGFRALAIANTHAPETPFIFVSGTIGEDKAIEAMHNGATDYLLKSSLARLSSAVERALNEASTKTRERESDRQRRTREAQLEHLARCYRMLSRASSAILQDHRELLDEICRIAVEQGAYDRAVISVIDGDTHSLIPKACAGTDSAPLRAIEVVTLDANARAVSLAQRAASSGAPCIINDLAKEAAPSAHQQLWLDHGWQAVAAFPVLIDGKAVAVMTLLSARRDVFDEVEIAVLLELMANLSIALRRSRDCNSLKI